MSDSKNNSLTLTKQEYKAIYTKKEPPRPLLNNVLKAFFVGGLIAVLGQGISEFYLWNFDFTEKTVGSPTSATLIIISVILTSIGIYDHIGQWAGAGTAVPVTGFANTVASAAIEHRSEGFVLGVGGNMFKIAGPVIVYGVFSSFVIALIISIITMAGGI